MDDAPAGLRGPSRRGNGAVATDDVALLLTRAGFGPTSSELAAAAKAGYAATLSTLTSPPGPDIGATSAVVPRLGLDPFADLPDPTPAQRVAANATRTTQNLVISRWWLDRMTVANQQATEKLLFFWHGHWATSVVKVKSPQLLLRQHLTLRAAPDFAAMAHQMVLDPALVYWLDGQENTKGAPNENLARELFELFTLGIGNYSESDIKQAARALTGWRVSLGSERSIYEPRLHDHGSKTILGTAGDFTADRLVDLILRQPACARFIATRLWYRYASSVDPLPEPLMRTMVAAFPAPMAMLRVLFADDAFRATRRTMVKQPIEWLVGAMRQLGLRPAGFPQKTFAQIVSWMGDLGQRPFAPPSVGGWPSGPAWLTSAAAQVRLNLAGTLAELAGLDGITPESVADSLCVDGWTDRTYAVLRDVRKPRVLMALGLVSPEYLVT
jgi:uncharacterized protein (DUF1800 family)